MKVSDQRLQTFITLYERKYGVVLEPQEAMGIVSRFLKLIELVESNSQ